MVAWPIIGCTTMAEVAMRTFLSGADEFVASAYASEAALEEAINEVAPRLFGARRLYFDIKKKIGAKGGQRNIPDGYLVDLSGGTPRLYVVENELAAHDPLRHIAVQILQFSLSFEAEPRLVRDIIFGAISDAGSDAMPLCEAYLAEHPQYRNLDHLVDALVFDSPFTALVIIDEIPENLETVLSDKFNFGVEVLELAPFEDAAGKRAYLFEPFLADLNPAASGGSAALPLPEPGELDTIVVPAREEGFTKVFLGEDAWYSVRIHGSMRPQIKFVAAYQTAPTSAITYIAPVKSIAPSLKAPGKWRIDFAEPAQAIEPIPLDAAGRVKAPQNIRYTTHERLQTAKTLDDLW
jgi:hypothetical protein